MKELNSKLTQEMLDKLYAPLPSEAYTQHPKKSFLTSIKPIFIIERLNEVFGTGGWKTKTEVISVNKTQETTKEGKLRDLTEATVKLTLIIDEYNIWLENYGGHSDVDAGDALKGSATDALTKIASYLGVGFDIYKDKRPQLQTQTPAQTPIQMPVKQPQQHVSVQNKPAGVDFKLLKTATNLDELAVLFHKYVEPLAEGAAKTKALEILKEQREKLNNNAIRLDENLIYNG